MKAGIFAALILVLGGLTSCYKTNKQFVYITGPGTNEVFQFQILSNGSLTPLNPESFGVGSSPVSIAFHPAQGFAYIANFAGNNVTLLAVNRGNGQLATPAQTSPIPPPLPPNIFNTQTGPVTLAIHPAGTFLFALNQTSGNISSFTIDPTTGNLGVISDPTTNQPFFNDRQTALVTPTSMIVTTNGNFLYVASPSTHAIYCFSVSSKGVLSEVSGSPFIVASATSTPSFMAVEGTGRFLYVADGAENAVLAFSIQSSGALTPINGSPFAGGTMPLALAAAPEGNLLYVANQGSNNVSAFVIDQGSGGLGAVPGSPFATGGKNPSFVVATGAFVFVFDQGTNDVAGFAIGSNGALTPVPNSPFNVPTSATWMSLLQ